MNIMFQARNQSLNLGWRVVIKSLLLFCTKWIFWEHGVTVAGGYGCTFSHVLWDWTPKERLSHIWARFGALDYIFHVFVLFTHFNLYFCRPHRGRGMCKWNVLSFISTPSFVRLSPACLTPVVSPSRNLRLPSFISCLPINVFLFCLSRAKAPLKKPQFWET